MSSSRGNRPSGPRPDEAPREVLVRLITEMKEEECLQSLRAQLAQGAAPLDLLGGCMEGMRRVGERFAEGRYFMAALIMAGEIMREATEILRPHLDQDRRPEGGAGTALIATVKGDIHDLGKNLFSLLLQCNGFEVDDLGVDVEARVILERAAQTAPDVVGISCILTSSLQDLRETVTLLKTSGADPRPPVIIGGCAVDAHVQEFVKADLWASDAAHGVELCRTVLSARNKAQSRRPATPPSRRVGRQ
jgi:methanogenic corrinoid protein MtbC1